MKDHWRTKSDGRKVKVDSNKSNDYSDGYNAARRYAKKHTSVGMVVYCTVAGIIIGALALNLYNLLT